jgi:hypothetical protein
LAGGISPSLTDLVTEKAIGGLSTDPRYVPGRRTFLAGGLDAPAYIPIPASPLNAEVAQLFAEVVTCYELDPAGTVRPLDEASWDTRRQQLARRLDEHPAPFPISRVVSDRWYWLRRQAGQAAERNDQQETIKYLDRLIAVEPTWQNYHWRGLFHRVPRLVAAAQDVLEAGKRAGEGYWCKQDLLNDFARLLVFPDKLTPQEYQMGLQLAEALSHAIPEDRARRLLLAIAKYRVGRYAEALSLLEGWQRERELAVVSQVGQFFLLRWPAALLKRPPVQEDAVWALAFRAMAYHRLGQSDRARAALAGFQVLGKDKEYRDLLREAETLIEGRPPPGK